MTNPPDDLQPESSPAICDYCESVAVGITRDGGELLCDPCASDQYRHPRDAVASLTPATRRRYATWR